MNDVSIRFIIAIIKSNKGKTYFEFSAFHLTLNKRLLENILGAVIISNFHNGRFTKNWTQYILDTNSNTYHYLWGCLSSKLLPTVQGSTLAKSLISSAYQF